MWDFDADEAIFLGVAAIGTAIWLIGLCARLFSAGKSTRRLGGRAVLVMTPVLCCAGTYVVIQTYSDAQVRGHADYLTLFMLGQGLWLAITCWCLKILGVDVVDDVCDRANPAAMIVVAGGMIATSIVYAGSNIGGGPTIWTTIVPAALGTLFLALLWILIDAVGGTVLDAISIDRDAASALRTGGALIGCGIILARAAAGTWTSWENTWSDLLRIGWPAPALAVAAGLVHRSLRPTVDTPRPQVATCGLIPTAAFVLAGLLVVAINPNPFVPSKW